MDLLTEKYISDEETDEEDGQGLVHRTLTWRAPKLNMLILKWDKRYNKKKDDLRPLKPRRDGEPSTRPIPKGQSALSILILPLQILMALRTQNVKWIHQFHCQKSTTAQK